MKWSLEVIHKEAAKHKSRIDFAKGNWNAYNAAQRRGILDEVCSHMGNPKNKAWTYEELCIEAKKHRSRGEFKKNNEGAYNAAHKMGVFEKICTHMPKHVDQSRESNPNYKWSYEKLQEEALRHKTRKEFEINSSGAYQVATRRRILDQICSHMVPQLIYWTDAMLALEALKYPTRGEFQKKGSSAYSLASNRNLLDKICHHMKPSKGPSLSEKELLQNIKSIYPSTKKIMDRRVKIANKPYIKGFEIDIFIPELNRGIEFDGKHYHSYKFMRKDKRKKLWPHEDIRNYHKLKDDWFASKGIKILHIKEEDWIRNKEDCINQCLKFLGG